MARRTYEPAAHAEERGKSPLTPRRPPHARRGIRHRRMLVVEGCPRPVRTGPCAPMRASRTSGERPGRGASRAGLQQPPALAGLAPHPSTRSTRRAPSTPSSACGGAGSQARPSRCGGRWGVMSQQAHIPDGALCSRRSTSDGIPGAGNLDHSEGPQPRRATRVPNDGAGRPNAPATHQPTDAANSRAVLAAS